MDGLPGGGGLTTVLATAQQLAGERLQVAGDAYRHLFRARRLRRGEAVRVVDGAGRARWATVAEVGRRDATLTLEGEAPANEPAREVTLVTAVPRPARARWLVEKATEVGVAGVHFIDCERSARRLENDSVKRLRRVAASAVAQAERARVPEISGTRGWDELEELLAGVDRVWLLSPGQGGRVGTGVWSSCVIVVGPEGGWTAAEIDRLTALGARVASVGPTTLRVETAAVIGASQALLAV